MLSCRETVELVCDGKPLPLYKKPRLWLHLAICKACRVYFDQITAIKNLGRKMNHEDAQAEKVLEKKILDKFIKNAEKE